VQGELASLKDTINTMVDGLGTLLADREVGFHTPCVYLSLLLWWTVLRGVRRGDDVAAGHSLVLWRTVTMKFQEYSQ
jgi:hypothetical protein